MITDPIETAMMKARVKLLLDLPLIGQIILHLDMEDATDWCDTAATDGRKIYYNREFVKKLTLDQLVFVLGHETLHVVLDHVYRRGSRDKLFWNMAIDYIVNYILKQSKVGEMPKSGLFNEDYTDDFSADELYTLLEQTVTTIKVPMDMHLDGDTNSGKGTGDGSNELGGTCGQQQPAPLTEAEMAEVRDKMRIILLTAAQNTQPGKMPAGIKRMIDRMMKPKLNWRQILFSLLRSAIKYDYTYTRLSRRSWNSGLILPGQDVKERVTATAWLDGSASTSQKMVSDFLGECRSIMATFNDYELTIGTFDTEVYNVKVFTPDNAHELHNYDFKGGGGTWPSCCWNYMKEKKLKPDKILLFTDGEVGNDWGDPDYADTIFIVHTNDDITAPYGRTIRYEA